MNRVVDAKLNSAVENSAAMTNAPRRDSEVSEARLVVKFVDLIKAKSGELPIHNPRRIRKLRR